MANSNDFEKERAGAPLGGIFRGLGDFVDLLSDLVDTASSEGAEISRSGTLGNDKRGVRAVYGLSVRLGGAKPVVERFGNIKPRQGQAPVIEELREPMVDVFDEGDHLLLVAELPGVEERDIHYEIADDVLCLSAVRDAHGYRKEVVLPARVDASRAISSLRNGIFELNLPKEEPESR